MRAPDRSGEPVAGARPGRDPRPRTPGLVYGGVTVAMLVLLAAVALTTRQPPPPSIAEFAPQAVEQIKDAPTEQSSEFGSGEGGSGLASEAAAPDQAPAKGPSKQIDVPRVRRCVGTPPRQIEDPQSPPCVPYWEGDNGGSTWKGVTRDEVRIFVPTGDTSVDIYPQLEIFFNRRFEFYGRKLKFIRSSAGTNAGSALPADQKAIAQEAVDANAFASLRYRTTQGFFYHEELARRGIPSVTGAEWGASGSYLDERKPYLWQYMPEAEVVFASLGEWACKRLARKTARHAGDPTLQATQRKFGVIMQTYYDGDDTKSDPLERELERCGAKPVKVLRNPIKTGSGDDTQYQAKDPVTAQNAVIQMQNAGATSVFCLCNYYAFGSLTKAASRQGYSPEWLTSSWGELDTIRGVFTLANATPEQAAHILGLSFRPPQIRNEDEPYWWAMKEADPTTSGRPQSTAVVNRNFAYRTTLLLASAIQMAGPKLTPDTLEKGLQRAIFPNPDHPNHPGKVGFRPSRYSMEMDGTEYWWSTTALHPYTDQGTGTPCYVDRARRYTKGQWPSGGDEVFFTPTCDSGA